MSHVIFCKIFSIFEIFLRKNWFLLRKSGNSWKWIHFLIHLNFDNRKFCYLPWAAASGQPEALLIALSGLTLPEKSLRRNWMERRNAPQIRRGYEKANNQAKFPKNLLDGFNNFIQNHFPTWFFLIFNSIFLDIKNQSKIDFNSVCWKIIEEIVGYSKYPPKL